MSPWHEALVLYPAWATLVGHISRSDPRTACPHSIYGAACGSDHDRLAALLFAHQMGDTLDESSRLLNELLHLAREGYRPRFAREIPALAPLYERGTRAA